MFIYCLNVDFSTMVKNQENQQQKEQTTINQHTPYEELFRVYSQDGNIWGGMFTLDYLMDHLTVEEDHKYWVVEKLVQNDVLIKMSVSLNDDPAYMISRGVEKIFVWLLESQKFN